LTASDRITVRDHSRPCEHGSLWPHAVNPNKAKWWQEPECLGGREMMLRSLGDGVWTEVDDEGEPSRP